MKVNKTTKELWASMISLGESISKLNSKNFDHKTFDDFKQKYTELEVIDDA